MKESTIFREIDELLKGVHGELSPAAVLKRVSGLIAQGDPRPRGSARAAATWLIHHAQWYLDRTGSRFVEGGGVRTRVERGWSPARGIRVYQSWQMECSLLVQADGQIILHTENDGHAAMRRGLEPRDEPIDMAEVARLDEQHPGKRLVERVKAALGAVS
jgi:hypothetical protein